MTRTHGRNLFGWLTQTFAIFRSIFIRVESLVLETRWLDFGRPIFFSNVT